jgi:hemin uptake protein HemP
MICFGLGWRALRECSCLLATGSDAGDPPTFCRSWLRGDIGAVKNDTMHFISIVNCSGWIGHQPACKTIHRQIFSGCNERMPAGSGDNTRDAGKHAGTASPATRSLIMSGNRIDSRDLFSTEREIIIMHGVEAYRLRLTSQNKLILTK